MDSIKFFKHDRHGNFYLAEWKTGYIQMWEDWSQLLSPKSYNWLNFRPIWFEIDYDKLAGENLEIGFGLIGFNVRFQQFIRQNKQGKKLKKDLRKIKTIEQAHNKEVKKLKDRIKKLEQQLTTSA